MNNHVIRKEQCPECAKKGNDRARDNLVIYSDGSCYCFSCHYYQNASGVQKLRQPTEHSVKAITLPADVSEELSGESWSFLNRYGITRRECSLNTILWSEYYKRLVFPYFNDSGLVAWQGRYLGQDKHAAKWYSKGNLRDLVHVLGNRRSSVAVFCEDVISAIKIARNPGVCAMPLFGSHVAMDRVLRVKNYCNIKKILLWLDKDKMVDSAKYARQVRQVGVDCSSIITELDPKCYSTEEIMELTNGQHAAAA